MPNFAGPEEAFAFIDDMLARLRHRSPDDGSHLYVRTSASMCADDMCALESALQCIAVNLAEGAHRNVRREMRNAYRLRLQELRLELSELEEALAADRKRIAQESRQIKAAAAWNESAHLV